MSNKKSCYVRAIISFVCAFLMCSCSTIRVVARDQSGSVSVSSTPNQPVNVTVTNEGNTASVLNRPE